jgi:hypothetical protein
MKVVGHDLRGGEGKTWLSRIKNHSPASGEMNGKGGNITGRDAWEVPKRQLGMRVDRGGARCMVPRYATVSEQKRGGIRGLVDKVEGMSYGKGTRASDEIWDRTQMVERSIIQFSRCCGRYPY